jgi:ferrous iron transport protein A
MDAGVGLMNKVRLNELKPHEEGVVVELMAGKGLTRRLCEMGIVPGARVKVLLIGHGPIVVETMGSRIAIGKGMASKILVEKIRK